MGKKTLKAAGKPGRKVASGPGKVKSTVKRPRPPAPKKPALIDAVVSEPPTEEP